MFRQMNYLILLVGVLGLISADLTEAADPSLVGWWKLDEGSGDIAYDSSGHGHDGTIEGGPQWVAGQTGTALDFGGTDDYVDCGNGASLNITDEFTLAMWIKTNDAGDNGHHHYFNKGDTGYQLKHSSNNTLLCAFETDGWHIARTPVDGSFNGVWHHLAGSYDGSHVNIYIDGILMVATAYVGSIDLTPVNVNIGRCEDRTDRFVDAVIDDARIYNRALTEQEIQQVMLGVPPGQASNPTPANDETDVLRNVVLSWEPGEFAAPTNGHKVYFGESFDEVNDAVGGVAQTATSYTPPQHLAFGKTYYWRVDEVNAPPTSHIEFKGEVWSFTTESYLFDLPTAAIGVNASSYANDEARPENTINSSGLDESGLLHSNDEGTMWAAAADGPQPVWIEYTFDKDYTLYEMDVWNHNGVLGILGIKEALVEYTVDGVTYMTAGTFEFAQAPGADGYAANTSVDLGGIVARKVKITAQSGYLSPGMVGLSEVRFRYLPVRAYNLTLADGTMDVAVDDTLGWSPGRQAAAHEICVGADVNDLSVVDTVSDTEYNLETADLTLGETYYYKIVEVNEVETPARWATDPVGFTVVEFLIVDDFESYNDIPAGEEGSNLVYLTWADGVDNPSANGSTMGYNEPFQPTMESSIVFDGTQSVPLFYNNTVAPYSEVTANIADLQAAEDWTMHGIKTLTLWFYGDRANNGGRLYAKINGVKIPYDGDPEGINWLWWTQWNIDLASAGVTNLENVTSLSIGVEGAGSSGTMYVDDIRLYAQAPSHERVVAWLEAEATTSITEPMRVWSDLADASGGQYIAVAADNISKGNPPTEGVATYTVTVPGGTYKVVGRVIAPGGGSDSFWVRIQGAGIDVATHASGWLHWSMENGSAWHWTSVNSYDAGSETVLFTMPAGTYTLEIAYREPGALLDAMAIVEDLSIPEPEAVLFEETFPNGEGNYKPLSWIGWEGYIESNATEVTTIEPGDWNENNIIVDMEDNKVFHLMKNVFFMFTEEPGRLSQLDVAGFSAEIQKTNTPFRFAVRIDTNSTPGDTSDDAWFVTEAGYIEQSQNTVVSALNTAASDWRDLTLNPGVELSVAAGSRTEDLPAGDLTAYGIYGEANGDMRIYNYKVLSIID